MANTASIVDYQVLFHGAFLLDAGTPTHEKTLTFSVPDDMIFASDSRKPVLAFHAIPIEDTRFKIWVNSREILSWHLGPGSTRGLWSPFNATETFPEGSSFSNTPPIRFLVSEGKMYFENVILWYQIKRNP